MWTNKLENPNSTWLSLRGTWLTNILIAMVLKVAFSILPGVSAEISWTLTNLTYNIVHHNKCSFFFLHWLLGTPFDVNQNEYYALTLWEQLDDGTQYTPNRKFLTLFPIVLFLLSAHYSHYDITLFTINVISLLVVLIAKLPQLHKVRIFGINKKE